MRSKLERVDVRDPQAIRHEAARRGPAARPNLNAFFIAHNG